MMQQPNLITPHFIEYDGWDSGQGFLGIIEVFALMTQPSCQLMHDFFEDHTVNILAQHVKKEPITHLKHNDNMMPKSYKSQFRLPCSS